MRLRGWIAALVLMGVALAAAWPATAGPQLPLPQARLDLFATARQVLADDPKYIGLDQSAPRVAAYLAYVSNLAAALRGPVPFDRLLQDEDLALNYLHDPHTNALAVLSESIDSPGMLPVGFYWAQDGLVAYRVQGSPAALRTGDQVLALGGVPVGRLEPRLRRYLSGNRPWLRTLAGWFLPFGRTLRWLGLIQHGRVDLRLQRASGQRYDLSLSLVPEDLEGLQAYLRGRAAFDAEDLAPGPAAHGGPFFAWTLTADYGIFWLRECADTPGFEAAVQSFFRAVQAAGVDYVIIDLQQDTGGNSAVGAAFLRHLPVRPQYAAQYGSGQDPSQVFHGKSYVLIDGVTMSSGVLVAEMLSEAGYGTLVGSPAGMASGGPGNVDELATPDGLVRYQVSTEFVNSVNGAITPALLPQVALPVTVRDIQKGMDPVARWLALLATPRVRT